jgi:carbon monoxide dehydrogenase subunit G
MELEHSFTVPVPMERAWDVLLDVERVAPCMPGATLDLVDGDEIHGKVKVKVGPINMTYAGTARFVEKDKHTGVVRLEASGKETKGAGTASAVVRSVLEDKGDHTDVVVLTTLSVTGKPAQFGRGVMNEVGGKLLSIFATNLAALLAQSDHAPATVAGQVEDAAAPAGAGDAAASHAAANSDAALEELHLQARALASLRKEGITTVGQLAAKTDDELLAIDGIGPASVEEIKAKRAEHGQAPAQRPAPAAAGAVPGSAGANGSSGSSKAAANGARTGATATAPPSPAGASSATTAPQEEALNLLSVAGMPVLKRALPVLASAGVTAVLIFGLRRRRRRHR